MYELLGNIAFYSPLINYPEKILEMLRWSIGESCIKTTPESWALDFTT